MTGGIELEPTEKELRRVSAIGNLLALDEEGRNHLFPTPFDAMAKAGYINLSPKDIAHRIKSFERYVLNKDNTFGRKAPFVSAAIEDMLSKPPFKGIPREGIAGFIGYRLTFQEAKDFKPQIQPKPHRSIAEVTKEEIVLVLEGMTLASSAPAEKVVVFKEPVLQPEVKKETKKKKKKKGKDKIQGPQPGDFGLGKDGERLMRPKLWMNSEK